MRVGFLIGCLLASGQLAAQQVTISPLFPKADQSLTLTVDVTGTQYANKTGDTYIWTWIPGANIGAPTNITPATAAQASAKWTRLSANVYTITFTPTLFYGQPLSAFTNNGNVMGFLLKGVNWSDGQTGDLFVNFFTGFAVQFGTPASDSFFVNNGQGIPITGYASDPSTITLKAGGVTVQTAGPGATTISYNHTVTETSGSVIMELSATKDVGGNTDSESFTYVVRSPTVQQPRPPGIIDGINYNSDQTKVTLGLWAPGKTSVYVLGDFNNWEISPAYQMKQQGEHFWLEITGLTPGTEYGYQYLVDETLKLADPYADKILDYSDDQYIPATTNPSLKAYPAGAVSDKWYFNRVAVFQTGQTSYPWVVTNFSKPVQENLVIYELLIRDYFESPNRNYQNLIDTLTYLKRLGVTAIELMPITEFNGNDSWGYNPTFMFAPDKYYGTKNKLKEFVDKCHQNGIAVIMDMVMNHHDTPNPYVMMDFDFTPSVFKPTANNKWFNVNAPHPYSVFFDMNHESSYTKKYLDTVNYYWLHEYKIDGFRYDLSKGFTQTVSNESTAGNRDNSRIAILERMADKIWSHTPNAYVILEHFADNSEEKELAEHGLMLWGNLNYSYNQNTIGLAANSDFSWVYHGTRSWNVAHAVGYMESHDEERMMYRNLSQGLGGSNYNVKDPTTAIERMKAINALFYTIPGPKMIWEFGELGYDISIDLGGRVTAKPVKWEYLADPVRKKLNLVTAELIKLKKTYPVFSTGDALFAGQATLQKQLMVKAVPFTTNPTSPSEMSVVVVGNFDISQKTVSVNFPHIGNWYHFYSGGDLLNVTNSSASITLQPGEARIYTNVMIPGPLTEEIIQFVRPNAPELLTVAEGDQVVNVQWQDKSSIETSYTIWRRPAGGTFAKVGTGFQNTQFYIDFNGLAPLTTFEYYVEATNSYGATASNILSVTTSDQITGLESEWRGVRVYPNPTTGLVTIDLPPSLAQAQWMVKNALGQTLNVPMPSEHTIDLGHQPPGMYIVVISSGETSRAFKVVKR